MLLITEIEEIISAMEQRQQAHDETMSIRASLSWRVVMLATIYLWGRK